VALAGSSSDQQTLVSHCRPPASFEPVDVIFRRIGQAIRRIGAEYVAEYETATGKRL